MGGLQTAIAEAARPRPGIAGRDPKFLASAQANIGGFALPLSKHVGPDGQAFVLSGLGVYLKLIGEISALRAMP